ncbi:hypothetical protein [Paenibacillus sp. SYP-B4298]|uniref:hypothetical protein n=1 Tax=Paenibacillus sp. SYP-B4298 TaxID=2996034 RepID=UPI0022DD8483|nr:hypothetical protein [Paenibacillus sp. SYP-B4298]
MRMLQITAHLQPAGGAHDVERCLQPDAAGGEAGEGRKRMIRIAPSTAGVKPAPLPAARHKPQP